MLNYASGRLAVGWNSSVWLNEMAFVFMYPVWWMRPPQTSLADQLITAWDTQTVRTVLAGVRARSRRLWECTLDGEKRKSELTEAVPDDTMFEWYQLILFVLGAGLRLVWFNMLMWEVRNIEDDADSLSNTLRALVTGDKNTVAITAVVLHVLAYFADTNHLLRDVVDEDSDMVVPTSLYVLGHVSVVNFVFDFPGYGIKNVILSHVAIICTAVAVGVYFFVLVVGWKPVRQFFGCYAVGTSVEDLVYGPCPAFLQRYNPEVSTSAVCNQNGVECDAFSAAWTATVAHSYSVATSVLGVTLLFYILSIPQKLVYYETMWIMYREFEE
jgi:hypothetical protein